MITRMYRKTEFRATRHSVRILHRGDSSDMEVIREEAEFVIGHDILGELQAAPESREIGYLDRNYKLITPREIFDKILEKYQAKS